MWTGACLAYQHIAGRTSAGGNQAHWRNRWGNTNADGIPGAGGTAGRDLILLRSVFFDGKARVPVEDRREREQLIGAGQILLTAR